MNSVLTQVGSASPHTQDTDYAIIGLMRRVVIIIPSSTYRATDFVSAAERLGLELVIASDRRPTLEAVMGDRSQVVRLDRPDEAAPKLTQLHERLPFDAVLGVDDQGVLIASLVAERLSLAHSPVAAVSAARDKARTRQVLTEAGLEQPSWVLVAPDGDVTAAIDSVGLPCVVKPLSLSASRGVIKASTPDGVLEAIRRVRAIVPGEPVLIEAYVDGSEVAVEALASAGEVAILAVFDKPDPLEGPYFEETIYVTPSRLSGEVQSRLAAELQLAATALGLSEGPLHAEFRLGMGSPVLLEVAARSIGGLCSRALRFGAGVSLEELILRHALGMGLGDLQLDSAASGVMMIPIPMAGTLREVRNLTAARAVMGVAGIEITIPPGQAVVPLPEGDRYLGFIFATGEEPGEVEDSLRKSHAVLDIDIEPGDPDC
jgi:biotin carboxylase